MINLSHIWITFCIFFSILVNVLQSQILQCMEHVIQVNLCQKLFFLENMGRTCCVQKLFWMSKTISVHNMFSPCSELGIFTYWTCDSMNNMSSYCGLVDAKITASDKDLPVQFTILLCSCSTWFEWKISWNRNVISKLRTWTGQSYTNSNIQRSWCKLH